jgi:hypothetical protein
MHKVHERKAEWDVLYVRLSYVLSPKLLPGLVKFRTGDLSKLVGEINISFHGSYITQFYMKLKYS